MRRATTPTHTFTFPEEVPVDFVSDIVVIYSQCGKTVLKKKKEDMAMDSEGNFFSCKLTDGETNLFAPGKALIQVRVKTRNGAKLASQMIWLQVKPVLESGEI